MTKKKQKTITFIHPILRLTPEQICSYEDEYYALTGNLEGFEHYLFDLCESELKRMILDVTRQSHGLKANIQIKVPDGMHSGIFKWAKKMGASIS